MWWKCKFGNSRFSQVLGLIKEWEYFKYLNSDKVTPKNRSLSVLTFHNQLEKDLVLPPKKSHWIIDQSHKIIGIKLSRGLRIFKKKL